ncbi:MAG: hypothetical protein ABI881_12910 [Betaproteobacteria bacterium]
MYLLTIGMPLATILLIFGMRYFSAVQQAKARLANDDAYRQIAERAVASQSETSIALKSIWLIVIAVPLWSAQQMDANTWETATACLWGVIFPLVIPWRHVIANFVMKPGDRWR